MANEQPDNALALISVPEFPLLNRFEWSALSMYLSNVGCMSKDVSYDDVLGMIAENDFTRQREANVTPWVNVEGLSGPELAELISSAKDMFQRVATDFVTPYRTIVVETFAQFQGGASELVDVDLSDLEAAEELLFNDGAIVPKVGVAAPLTPHLRP